MQADPVASVSMEPGKTPVSSDDATVDPARSQQDESKYDPDNGSIDNASVGSRQEAHSNKKPRQMKPVSWAILVISLMFSVFLFALDNIIVANIQPAILDTLGEVDKLPWISVGYAMGATAVNLFVSKLFSSFNNKTVFITGVAIFETGSVICGAAPNMTALIFGRTISGAACTSMYVGCINMLSHLTTVAERPLYFSFSGAAFGVGTIFGPIISGAFADGPATWRWCFYINLCIGAFIVPVYVVLLPSYCPRDHVSFRTRIGNLDWAGGVLFAGATVCLVMGISFGGSVYLWDSGRIIALFVIAGVLWIAFALQQSFAVFTTKEDRIMPFAILKNWEMQILFVQSAAGMAVLYITLYFVPLYFQFVQNQTAFPSAKYLLPFVFAYVVATLFNGAVMGKFGYYMPWYLFGGILSIVGGALFFATVTTDLNKASIFGYSVLCGLGSGLFKQAGLAVAQAKVEKVSDIPPAVAFMGCGQIVGITLALAIANTVFINKATARIESILPTLQISTVQSAITGADSSFFTRTLDEDQKARVLSAIVRSIDDVFAMVITAGAVVIVLSLFMSRERLFERAVPDRQPEKVIDNP